MSTVVRSPDCATPRAGMAFLLLALGKWKRQAGGSVSALVAGELVENEASQRLLWAATGWHGSIHGPSVVSYCVAAAEQVAAVVGAAETPAAPCATPHCDSVSPGWVALAAASCGHEGRHAAVAAATRWSGSSLW